MDDTPSFTPTFFVDYFSSQATTDQGSVQWIAGLQAARLWMDYHTQQPHPSMRFPSLIRVLMPHRWAGSGFYGLWTHVVIEITRLPVSDQIPLWQDIFTSENFGDRQIEGAHDAQRLLARWREIATDSTGQTTTQAVMQTMLDDVFRYFPGSYEWMVLINTLHTWFEGVMPDVSFRHLVLARRREHHLSQGHTNQ